MEKVNFEQYYERKLNEYIEDLKLEYQPKIDEAADFGYVVNKIIEEVSKKIKSFYYGYKGDLSQTDFYKEDLLLNFDDCQKSFRKKPVEQFIKNRVPKIQSKHQLKMKEGHVFGYELDPEFINITDYKVILGFIANYYAFIEVSNWLKYLLGKTDGTLQHNNDSELTNTFDNLNTTLELEDYAPIAGLDSSPIKVDLRKKETKKTRKMYKTFESLFFEETHAIKLIEFLIENNILDKKGNWDGITNFRTEFIVLIDELKSTDFGIIRFSSYREVGNLFKTKFNISVEIRSFTLRPNFMKDIKPTYRKLVSEFYSKY